MKLLLSSVSRPFAVDDAHGRKENRMELFQPRRIVETDMQTLDFAGKYRAALVGMVTDSHDVIERDIQQVRQEFGSMAGNIDAGLGHDLHGNGA